jgi:three-Cys-motif partner protein
VKPIDASFFDGKRPWSQIKDQVLGNYLPPYLRKTQRLPQPIVIVDCFAGRGTFSDGSPGSPLIICQQIKQHAPERATAYFVNKRPEHHDALTRTLKGFMDTGIAHPALGQGETFLSELSARLQDQTLFVYLDPFGIKGCNFAATKTLFRRSPSASTEMLMTLSAPILHRLAAKNSAHGITAQFHAVLDAVLGEVAWRDIMYDRTLSAAQKEERVIAAYCDQLRKYTNYACACPVRDRDDSRVKYYIVFASRHVHALLLMNDIMLNAYQEHTFAKERERMPLFENTLEDWRTTRDTEQEELANLIAKTVRQSGPIRRATLWQQIVVEHFMQYREAEFRETVQTLVKVGTVIPDQTGRLNDLSILRTAPRRTADAQAKQASLRLSS